jgi:hypothetical protein
MYKTLRWCEPFGGWGPHHRHYDDLLEGEYSYDTGLCNRILHWEIAYDLLKRCNFEYDILLPKIYWPELELLELPNTKSIYFGYQNSINDWFPEEENLKFKTVFDTQLDYIGKSFPIDVKYIENLYSNYDIYLNHDHLYSDFGFLKLKDLYEISLKMKLDYRPLSLIKLKHKFVRNLIEKTTKNLIGIHIRRSNGVCYTDGDVNSFNDSNLSNLYLEIRNNKYDKKHQAYTFISDDYYFKIIENILKMNSSEKFYISCDLPHEFLNPYYERYGNRIVTNDKILDRITLYLDAIGISFNESGIYKDTIKNVVDLFGLSNCKFLITSENSTWSEFATYYKNIPSISIKKSWESEIYPFLLNFYKN